MQAYAIFAPEKGKIDIEAQELPPLGPNQVLIETHFSTISPGTELAFLHHRPNTTGQFPMYFGYSACGRILDKGGNVEGLEIGQRVVGQYGHATHAVVNADACAPVPDGVEDVDAAVFRLGSIVLQGIRKAQIQLGWSVAILGLGPIGHLAGQFARVAGAGHVLGIDPLPWRRDLALGVGYEAVAESVATVLDGDGFEAVIEATGVADVVPSAFQLAKRLGHVVLLASSRGETNHVNFYRDVHKKGLTIFGAHDSIRASVDDHLFYTTGHTDETTVLKLLAGGRIQMKPLISDIVSFEDAERAYQRLNQREEHLMTIVFRWK